MRDTVSTPTACMIAATCAILGLLAGAGLHAHVHGQRIKRVLAEAEADRQAALAEAAEIVAAGRRDLETERKKHEREIQNARDEAEKLLAVARKEMHKHFDNLHRYVADEYNVVSERYLAGFHVIRGRKPCRVAITLAPTGASTVRPNVTLYFLNEYGFVTGEARVAWLLDRIAPGERKIEQQIVTFRHGEPVYYRVQFN